MATHRTMIKADKRAALRKAILDAAAKLFIERGLGGTSMQDIARELGLTRTAVYYYFKNKEEILKGLTEDVTLAAKQMTAKVAAQRDIDPAQALRALVEQHASLILSRSAEFRVVDRSEEDMPPKLRAASEAARRGIFENFSAVIQRGLDSGSFHRTDARVAALVILGMCNWTAWWFKPDGRKSAAEIAALIADLAVRSIQSQPGRQAKQASVPERLQGLRDDLEQIADLVSRRKP
jgi:AcrR family transcriptional regulator